MIIKGCELFLITQVESLSYGSPISHPIVPPILTSIMDPSDRQTPLLLHPKSAPLSKIEGEACVISQGTQFWVFVFSKKKSAAVLLVPPSWGTPKILEYPPTPFRPCLLS